MTWSAGIDKTTGSVVSAADWNKYLGTTGSINETAAAKVTTAEDLVVGAGANSLKRIGVGSNGDVLTVSSGVVTWGAVTLPANSTVATSLAIGTTPAATGLLRLPNNFNGVLARNAANSADVHLLGIGVTNRVEIASSADAIVSGVLKTTSGGGVQISTPTGGDRGAGTLNVAADVYKNNTAYTNPDYALEHAFRGVIERFKDREGASGYPGLMPLAEVEAFAREHLHLPRVSREPLGMFARGDVLLEKVEELFLYLFAQERRITTLEALLADRAPAGEEGA